MYPQLIETLQINNRINLYLLDAIDEKNLGDTAAGKGLHIGKQFAHLHNVRLMWSLESIVGSLESKPFVTLVSSQNRFQC